MVTEKCLDGHSRPEECEGAVEYRTPLSGTGRSYPRCDAHWSERLDTQEQISNRYPDTPNPPPGFREDDAGERWNADD